MKLDALVDPRGPQEVARLARAAEELGFARIRIPETRHEPFVMAALALSATDRLEVGTEVAIAFARSPTVVAHAAWDLAALGAGRFRLGLGSQVKAHIERRYGMAWEDPPVARMREFVGAVRAVWGSWQHGTPLVTRGRWYSLSLMTPFFSPGPIAHAAIPIGLAGVGPAWARLAGEVADAFHVHPFHTASYLRDVLVPAARSGLARRARPPAALSMVGSVFVVTGWTGQQRLEAREAVRRQIGFYASTPSYRRVLEHHGMQDAGARLSALARTGRWGELGAAVPEELVREAAVEGQPDEIAALLRQRYGTLLDRIALYLPFRPGEHDRWWADLASALLAS